MNNDPVISTLHRAGLWAFICAISAAPSFMWALREFDSAGMLCGIACFILAYTVVSGTGSVRELKSKPFIARTFWIGYGTRLLVSTAFPVGMVLDLYTGMVSVAIVSGAFASSKGFWATFTITLVQGTLLNIVLGVYMAVIYGLQRLFCTPPRAKGLCEKCGYDLRASPIRCPECGTAVPLPQPMRVTGNTVTSR